MQRAVPNSPNNLWEPVDEQHDHGAHGAFDSKATSWSWQLWADTHVGLLALVGAGIASLVGAALFWRKQ